MDQRDAREQTGVQAEPADIAEPLLPSGVHLPRPTVWPAVLASGVTLLAWGLITNYAVSLAGFVLFVVAAVGWGNQIRVQVRDDRARRLESGGEQ
jgi:hypothetical protein